MRRRFYLYGLNAGITAYPGLTPDDFRHFALHAVIEKLLTLKPGTLRNLDFIPRLELQPTAYLPPGTPMGAQDQDGARKIRIYADFMPLMNIGKLRQIARRQRLPYRKFKRRILSRIAHALDEFLRSYEILPEPLKGLEFRLLFHVATNPRFEAPVGTVPGASSAPQIAHFS